MKKNIALVGMMGCGKTTVAKELNKLLPEMACIDADDEIEKSAGKKISEIFLKFGEAHFRMLESEKIKKIFAADNQIISLGGGAFESEVNRKLILENADVIYLKTSAEEIHKRIKNEFHRPLLAKNFSVDRISDIMTKREPNYQKADYTIITDNKTPEEISKEIIGVLE
ncbi:shikimate kinase [bacterium]|nr:shikimate kinase [bacterium]